MIYEFTIYENEFIKNMECARSFVDYDNELEMHYDCDDECWYAYQYSEKRCEAYPISHTVYGLFPVIYDTEIKKYKIDIDKCFKKVGCYIS